MIDTGELTSYLVDHLSSEFEATAVMVGDGIAPSGAGWTEGTPNTTQGFIPYVVLRTAGSVTATMQNTPLCTTLPVRLDIPYMMVAYENTRAGADAVAARARAFIKSLPTTSPDLGDLRLRSHDVWIDSMLGAVRDDSVYPQMWASSTNFHVGVARVSE